MLLFLAKLFEVMKSVSFKLKTLTFEFYYKKKVFVPLFNFIIRIKI